MNFENQAFNKRKTEKEKDLEMEENNRKGLKVFFSNIFENNTDPEKRFSEFLTRFDAFIDIAGEGSFSQEEIKEIKESIKNICSLDNENSFIESGVVTLEPLLAWQKENKGIFEAARRKDFIENSGYIPLNEMLSYGRDGNDIHIHVAPSETLSIGEKYALLKDGFRNLQEVVKEDETIKQITATSWIVATDAGRGILEKFGFVVGKTFEDRKNFKTEKRAEAIINREDFLKQTI